MATVSSEIFHYRWHTLKHLQFERHSLPQLYKKWKPRADLSGTAWQPVCRAHAMKVGEQQRIS